jgi:surface protein
MKNLRKFNTKTEYSGATIYFPSVSYIKEIDGIKYDKINVLRWTQSTGQSNSVNVKLMGNATTQTLTSDSTSTTAEFEIYGSPETIKSGIFSATGIKTFDFTDCDTSNINDMSNMFALCTNLASINLSSFNTANVSNMSGMFMQCNAALSVLDLSSFDTSNVTNMYAMFNTCASLVTLDCSSWDTSKVTSYDSMFTNCSALKTIYVKNAAEKTWFKARVTEASLMGVTVTVK